VGITILVVAIVVLLLNTNLGASIADTFTEKINSVLNSGGGGGGGGGAG
jgi:nucleoside permease NupC